MYRYNRSSPFERTPEKRVSRQESQRKSIELPKLPPLNTRNSFLDDSDNGTDNISIGWTPISDTQQFQSPVPQAFTFTSKHSARGNGTSSSESTPKSTKYVKERRPPPPPPLLYSTESIRIDSPMVSPSSQSRERSPNKLSFIGNSEERHHMEYISNHSRILKSPFANGFSPNSLNLQEIVANSRLTSLMNQIYGVMKEKKLYPQFLSLLLFCYLLLMMKTQNFLRNHHRLYQHLET